MSKMFAVKNKRKQNKREALVSVGLLINVTGSWGRYGKVH